MPVKGKTRPRTKPPEERRKEIMHAARLLFLEHGVTATTVEQITARADVAKGTFYLYFTSKEDVLAAMGDRYGEDLLTAIIATVAEKAADDWKGRLAAWAEACVTGYLDSIQLHDILFYGSRPARREGQVDNVVVDDLYELLRAGAKAGAWSVEDERLAAVFLFSGMHGAVDDAPLQEKKINRGRLVERVQRLCFGAVGLL